MSWSPLHHRLSITCLRQEVRNELKQTRSKVALAIVNTSKQEAIGLYPFTSCLLVFFVSIILLIFALIKPLA